VGVAAAEVIGQMFGECNLLCKWEQPIGIDSNDE
jgi:hypothetical protein